MCQSELEIDRPNVGEMAPSLRVECSGELGGEGGGPFKMAVACAREERLPLRFRPWGAVRPAI